MINMDFSERIVVDSNEEDWVESPKPSVWRKPLAREDAERGQGNLKVLPLHQFETESVALVHWPKGETFHRHVHMGGEEVFVISGEFIDEHGRYPAGTWIRSPHMSTHTPYVEEETLLWVKVGHLPI